MVRERRNWTAEEDALLKNAVELARGGDSQSLPWNSIALSVPGRTNKDCRKRFHYKISSNVNRGAWTRTEDERLRAAVKNYGSKWCRVAIDVGTRNGDQCSKRWKNTIDPRIDRSAWSSQDEQLLTQIVGKMGHNWKAIVNNHFPGRTALQARNQYNQFCRRTGYDIQPPTLCSMQSPETPVPTDRSLSRLSPARTKSRRSHLRRTPTDTDFEHEESDYNLSSEEEIPGDDDDDADWLQSENCSQWDLANESNRVQARHNASHQYSMSPHEFESLKCPLPSDGMMPSSSFNYLSPDQPTFAGEDDQALEQPASQPYTSDQVSSLNLAVQSPSQFDWINFSNTLPVAMDSLASRETKKQVVIAATCPNSELQNLVQTTADALESVSYSITSPDPLSTTERSPSLEGGSRYVIITAYCLPNELGKLMQMITDNMGSVSFTVSSGAS